MANKNATNKSRAKAGQSTYRRKNAAPPTAPTTLNRQRNRYSCGGKLKK